MTRIAARGYRVPREQRNPNASRYASSMVCPSARQVAVVIGTVSLMLWSTVTDAQVRSDYKVSFGVGVGQFDMRGTATELVANARIDRPLFDGRGVVELNVGHASVQEQFAPRRTQLLFYEAQLQAQIRGRTVAPYVGAGAGGIAFLSNADDRQRVSGALSAAGGVRLRLTSRVSLRPEVRLRFWGASPEGSAFSDSAVEYTIGVRF